MPEIEKVYCYNEREQWRATITHAAWCGHSSCGLEFTVVEFVTASEAMTFIANLPTSWENYNA